MGAGKLRVRAGRAAAAGLAALAAACGHAAPAPPAAVALVGPTTTATPTVSASAVPALGAMTYGAFPATSDGLAALALCEQWAVLRAQYVTRVLADTPYQLEQWFSSATWRDAFTDNKPLRTDPSYVNISVAFGLATTGDAASVANARMLDRACAAAD
jgi:hypothetical protein